MTLYSNDPFLIILMSKTYIIIAITALLISSMPCLATDKATLLAFKSYITNDPLNILTKSWSTSSNTPFCKWIGVSCDAKNESVIALNLTNMSLSGTIAPHLGNLSFLTSLDLSFNKFRGVLPLELGKLNKLKHFVLLNNSLTGGLPGSVGNMTELVRLDLANNLLDGELPVEIGELGNIIGLNVSSNELYGEIPDSLYKCKELQFLSLSNNKFSGSIARGIGNLTNLRKLDLGTNSFQGEIPEEIGKLKSLEQLSIDSCSLTGAVPSSIFNISSLVRINLDINKLSGSLPPEICYNVPSLKYLYLSYNFITGQIPEALWKCKGLLRLDLSNNNLTGSISRNIGNVTTLRDVNFGFNNFTGELPSELGNLKLGQFFVNSNSLTGTIPFQLSNVSTLEVVTLQDNLFSGNLPSDFGMWLPNLVGLYIGNNYFTGLIPSSISNASNLIILEMSSNKFSGPLPNDLGNLQFLQRVYVGENNLTRESSTTELRFLNSLTKCMYLEVLVISLNQFNGVLPASFGNLSSNLNFLSAFGAKIKGEIPMSIGNLSGLDALMLDSNEFTGRVPRTIGFMKNIERVYLEHNRLQGPIPNEFCLLERMGDLYFSHNQLNGSIPSCLGELKSLRRLYLDSNKFSSDIPSSLWTRVDLTELNLSTNLLSGDLAPTIGSLKVVTKMDLSVNLLSGNVPSSISGAQSLGFLSLAYNRLQGSIPQSMGSLFGLETLDLSGNNLSGTIPKSFEGLKYLSYFNVSFNHLDGEIPSGGNFVNFTAQSYMGNDGLCGAARLQVLLCPKTKQSGSKNTGLVKYVVLPIVAAILLVAVIVVVLKRRRKDNVLVPQEENSIPHDWKRVPYLELSRATDGFSEENLLGRGGFGSVYKGTLSDGMIVAIKVFNIEFEGASKSFEAECEVMRNVRHRNVTKLISSCTNLDFKALVLEWMPNRCLDKCLYSQDYSLDFVQRLNIMIDVAFALNYLHHGHTTPIVHCDLKPSNVLLDQDMIAHVCDFGIARFLGEEEFMSRTKTLATIGYMAPEYGREGIVSTRGDVYSYGVLLMETFTRKRPTDEMFSGEMSLKDWVKEGLNGSVTQVLDSSLMGTEDKLFYVKEQCASSIFNLAMDCSKDVPMERINMEEAVVRLNKMKTIFVEQCHVVDIRK